MRVNPPPSRERLLEMLDYKPEDGVFTWRTSPSPFIQVGAVAGATQSGGYRQITLDGVSYMAHRLAWFIVYSEWPADNIDHVNRRRLDNRIKNLRLCSHHENMQNTPVARHNTSGVKGVDRRVRPNGTVVWRARIGLEGCSINLGCYSTREAAIAARAEVEASIHPLSPLAATYQISAATRTTIKSILGKRS